MKILHICTNIFKNCITCISSSLSFLIRVIFVLSEALHFLGKCFICIYMYIQTFIYVHIYTYTHIYMCFLHSLGTPLLLAISVSWTQTGDLWGMKSMSGPSHICFPGDWFYSRWRGILSWQIYWILYFLTLTIMQPIMLLWCLGWKVTPLQCRPITLAFLCFIEEIEVTALGPH